LLELRQLSDGRVDVLCGELRAHFEHLKLLVE
jgi:hypothetical protein